MVTYSPGFGFLVGDIGKQKTPGNPDQPTMEAKSKQPAATVPAAVTALPAGAPLPESNLRTSKTALWRRVAPCLAFLAAFSTAMALLLVWSEATALRRQAFDANMTKDYVLNHVTMDNPQLVQYIREMQLKPTTSQEPLNASQTWEEKMIASLFQNKRDGVYLEYISRIGAISTTSWLESNLSWRGILVLTDSRSFFEARRDSRNPKTRVLHACLSTDKDTKEITLPQESEVQVTKLGEGPNSLVLSDENLPTTRIKCFPLYSVLLAYNTTSLDYLSLDGQDIQDTQVLDTIPWDKVKISVLSIHWGSHHNEAEKKSIIEKLTNRRYTYKHTQDSSKLIFYDNRLLKM